MKNKKPSRRAYPTGLLQAELIKRFWQVAARAENEKTAPLRAASSPLAGTPHRTWIKENDNG